MLTCTCRAPQIPAEMEQLSLIKFSISFVFWTQSTMLIHYTESHRSPQNQTSIDFFWACLCCHEVCLNSAHIPTHSVPYWAFDSVSMNIPIMSFWTRSAFDLSKNHIQIFLQCSPHTHIHTQHMCVCLHCDADRELASDESTNAKSALTSFRKIWFRCWNTGALLLQNGHTCVTSLVRWFWKKLNQQELCFVYLIWHLFQYGLLWNNTIIE